MGLSFEQPVETIDSIMHGTTTLEDFVATAFSCFGLDWRDHVVLNPTFLRPLDITFSSASPAKAERLLGWKATKKMRDVVASLAEAERERARASA